MRGSVSSWLSALKAGEEAALAKLHARYAPLLVNVARRRLNGAPRGAVDEEDVAQEAFWSFFRSLKAGRIPRLENRRHFLALLTHIIACKAVNQLEREIGTQKRGQGSVQGGSALDVLVADTRPTPLEVAISEDEYRRYVEELPEKLRPYAELHVAGFTHKEIAEQLSCVERTVERKMALVCEKWRELSMREVEEENHGSHG